MPLFQGCPLRGVPLYSSYQCKPSSYPDEHVPAIPLVCSDRALATGGRLGGHWAQGGHDTATPVLQDKSEGEGRWWEGGEGRGGEGRGGERRGGERAERERGEAVLPLLINPLPPLTHMCAMSSHKPI